MGARDDDASTPSPAGAAPPQRQRLQLLPHSVPLEAKLESTPAASTVGSEDKSDKGLAGGPSLSEMDVSAAFVPMRAILPDAKR